MSTVNATTKHLPRTAGQIGFARAATMRGANRVELGSVVFHPLPGLQPWSCEIEDSQGSPGPGDA